MTNPDPTKTIIDELTIEDPELGLIIFHYKKRQILELLIKKAMTIQELRIATKINPGTIKRHLEDLQQHNLVFVESTSENEFHNKMKYYRAIARSLLIKVRIPNSSK